jgi:putative PIN family toxin of toxin-antitoxin system
MNPVPSAALLKAVLDTNIYIAAFQYPRGRNAALWREARAGRFHLLVSPAIIREMARVLRSDSGWEDDPIQKVIRRIVDVARGGIVHPRKTIHAVAADPDDNRIIECAVEGKADLIVSNDHHLLDMKAWAGMPIVASVDFRRTLGLK